MRGPLVAFSSGVGFCTLLVVGVELWFGFQVRRNKFIDLKDRKIMSALELKNKFPNGIYPDPPIPVPIEKRDYHNYDLSIPKLSRNIPLPDTLTTLHSYRNIMTDMAGTILWDIPFYFDRYRRRRVPGDLKKNTTSHYIALFGDSNILGYGLREEETVAEFLSRKFPRARVYNYSDAGIYPSQILEYTEGIDRVHEIPEKDGVALYFYFSYHIRRNMGGIEELSNPLSSDQHVVGLDQNGEFIKQGKFKDETSLRFLLTRILRTTNTFRYLRWDLLPTERDYLIQTALIRKMRKNLKESGFENFYVVIHPWPDDLDETQILLKYLHEEKIPFIYFGHWPLKDLTEGPYHLKIDGHMSANANKVLATGLSHVLANKLLNQK